MAADHIGQIDRSVALQIPAVAGTGRIAHIAHGEGLVVTAVSPIGVEIACGPVLEPVLGRILKVGEAVIGAARNAVPGAGAGADVELDVGGGKGAALLVKGVLRPIAPIEGDAVLGQGLDELGLMEDDVAPELHPAPPLGAGLVNALEEVQVDLCGAAGLCLLLAPPLAQLPGLVAAYVEHGASEVRKVFVIQTLDKLQTFGGGGQGGTVAAAAAPRVLKSIGALGQVPVLGVAEPAFEVAEGVEVGHQFDETVGAVGVDLQNLLVGEGACIVPDRFVVAEGEGMFDVELELVDAQAGEAIDEQLERLQGGHLAAAYVHHDAAGRKVRRVVYGE